jgi:hypothetical protein
VDFLGQEFARVKKQKCLELIFFFGFRFSNLWAQQIISPVCVFSLYTLDFLTRVKNKLAQSKKIIRFQHESVSFNQKNI